MASQATSTAEWRRLYSALQGIAGLTPWTWMTETDLFGVQDPVSGDMGFVSVMGMLGEHYAIGVYPGPTALYQFWNLQMSGPEIQLEAILEIPQLQASLEDRDQLSERDRAQIKQLGLKFRGKNAWPLFRSFRAGYAPWYLEPDEVRLLTVALEQLAEVAPRFRDDPNLLGSPETQRYLIRVPRGEAPAYTWEDEVRTIPPPEPLTLTLRMDTALLARAKTLPHTSGVAEMDLFLLPTPAGDRGERPHYPFALIVSDSRSGMIMAADMLWVEQSPVEMWSHLPIDLLERFLQIGMLPGEVRVRPGTFADVVELVAEELRFKVNRVRSLPNLEAARTALFERFR